MPKVGFSPAQFLQERFYIAWIPIFCALAQKAEAQSFSDAPDTVQKMLRACDLHRAISDHGAKYAFCKGMARGIFRVMYLIMSDPLRLCDAKDLTGRQIVQIFTNWAKTNPEYWHVVPEEGFILALREAYPCK